jgi:hypothetical protein
LDVALMKVARIIEFCKDDDGEAPMVFESKNKILPALVLVVTAVATARWALSKQPSAEVPVWYAAYTRALPGKLDQYVGQMQLLLVPVLEEDKRQGGLLDYKVLRKINGHGPDDWNIELIVIFKNHAHMDGYRARWEAISKKINGDREEVDRNQMRIDVGADLLEEIRFN